MATKLKKADLEVMEAITCKGLDIINTKLGKTDQAFSTGAVEMKKILGKETFNTYVINGKTFNGFDRAFEDAFANKTLAQYTLTVDVEQSLKGDEDVIRYNVSNAITFDQLEQYNKLLVSDAQTETAIAKASFAGKMMNADRILSNDSLASNAVLLEALMGA